MQEVLLLYWQKKIIDARKDILTTQTTTLQRQEDDISKLKADQKEASELIKIDVDAIKRRHIDLETQLKDVQQKLSKAQELSAEKSSDALKKQNEATQRRLDVYRLSNELKELRADRYRVEMQLKKSEDALTRLKGINLLLESRKQQLQQQ